MIARANTRPVITGIGVVAPTGLDAESHWQAIVSGKSGLGLISRFDASRYPVKVAGEARDFVPEEHIPSRLVRETDLMTQLAFVATAEALADAGMDPPQQPDLEMSVVTSSSSGGVWFGQSELQNLYREGPRAVSAYMSIAWFYAATTGQLSIRHGMRGHSGVIATEQAGGLDALAQARRMLARGVRVVVCGGTDASLSPYGLVCQLASGLLSRSDEPAAAYLPFDAEARGYVPGEGGAILIVEESASARCRGAPRIYGELAGYAATTDPRPGSARPPGLRRAIELALHEAALRPDDVDVVFADGYGVGTLDQQEAEAITQVFGHRGVPVTVPKTMTGRLYAGGAPLDVATALLALRDGLIPPTIGPVPRAGYGIDLVSDVARPARVRTALLLARGYGGFNAAAVVTAQAARSADRQTR